MSNPDSALSIWQTINYYINDSTESDELEPLRYEVAKYLIGEPLSQIGVIENEYSYTEIPIENGIPDAFAILNDEQTLSLIVLVGRLGNQKLPNISLENVKNNLKDIELQLTAIAHGSTRILNEGREGVGEFVNLIRTAAGRIQKIEIKIIALGSVKEAVADHATKLIKQIALVDGKPVQCDIELFDIPALQHEWDKSSKTGTIDLNLAEFLGHPLRCLKESSTGEGFEIYLAIIPGDALANIYARYKNRILQKNLRNFLQVKGKTNKGIQLTLLNKPERFLAYNNGLTITATEAILNESGQIVTLKDFQIVNGGQTTASLDYFKRFSTVEDIKRQEALKKVSVQAKITVIDTLKDPSFLDEVSNYANSQNAVKLSDFVSRDKFQENLAKLMRANEDLACVWDDGRVLFWYYESFRGNYLTEKHQLFGAKRRMFETRFPKDQVINKLDLAKCENGWDGYPYFVCRGAEKNFQQWLRRKPPQFRSDPDIQFCRELVAKFLLFKEFDNCAHAQGYAGFKSQIVSLSFSYFRHILEIKHREIDLNKIWELGYIPSELIDSIVDVIIFVGKFLPAAAKKEDPAQWAKKPVAWEKLKETVRRGSYPKILNKLKSTDLLRPLTIDMDVLLFRALEELIKSRNGLRKVDLVNNLDMDETDWTELRRRLMSSSEVVQTGAGTGTVYKIIS